MAWPSPSHIVSFTYPQISLNRLLNQASRVFSIRVINEAYGASGRQCKYDGKIVKLSDGGGLYLYVTKTNSAYAKSIELVVSKKHSQLTRQITSH